MYAVIDIETTGGNYRWGKITEVAIFVHDGKKVTEEFSTLINPGISIPPFITHLTGISDEMVKDAPLFEEVAPVIERLTADKIFVAHNSQFDYNFIRHEFRSIGHTYERPTLCTVRAGRRILPHQPSYSLGKLCALLNIELENRHRAGGDAAATVKLLELLLETDRDNHLESLICWQQPSSEYNKYLQNTRIEELPQTPGLIYLMDENDAPLYIEGVRNIRKRVLSHLRNKGGRSTVNVRLKLKDVEYEETGTFLIAQLRAKEEILRIKPPLNPTPKAAPRQKRWYVVPDLQLDGYMHLRLERLAEGPVSGSFRTKKEALEGLEKLIAANRLCAAFTPVSGARSTCINGHKVFCQGACLAEETPAQYNARIDLALQNLEKKDNFLIVEKGRNPLEKALIKIEDKRFVSWGYLNVNEGPADLPKLLECATIACRSHEAGEIAQNYLARNNVQRVINF